MIAGGGRFPVIVAQSAKKRGLRVVCIGHKQFTPPELSQICDCYVNLGLGRLGAAIRFFKRHGVTEISWAGWIRKERLFLPWRLLSILPDWRMLRLWYFKVRNRQDATLLSAIADEFASEGIRVIHSMQQCPELLAEEGTLTTRSPTAAQWEDIRFGWGVAKRLADLDVGQSVVVCEKTTLAVEGIEGTDRCIRRAGEFYRRGGFTVVKLAKEGHDMRFDVPTIGPDTIESLVVAKGAVLAVEAGRTMVIEREETIHRANKQGIVLVSLKDAARY